MEHAARAQLDELSDLITVPRTVFDQRKNEQLSTAFLQFAIENVRTDIRHSHILFSSIIVRQIPKSEGVNGPLLKRGRQNSELEGETENQVRSARTGSMRVARQAGRKHAISATTVMMAKANANASGS